jgi:hypothetical protein
LLSEDEIGRANAAPWRWGETAPFRAIVTQTADPAFQSLDPGWFPELELLFDGRNSLRGLELPKSVAYQGVGVPGTR